MSVQPTPYLTAAYPNEFERQIEASVPGQAYFAETGPFATTCGECVHLNDHRKQNGDQRRRPGCLMYLELTGNHGDSVPRRTPSCKHYAGKE